ncbi:MAG TPA: nuclear transport factor 2 family protein [Aggregatilineaceae bacterium]|nr:nuclear transport factor 2 family protein [Aggregatilineaceae bacterium]
MINHGSVTRWLQDYVSAWKSYDPHAIRALFSEDATYRYNPYDEPVRGREAILANWLEYRDVPNTYTAEYKPVAVDGDTAVANGRTFYYEADGKTLKRQYDNIFVLRFDDEGRCTEFCEWFMQPR